MELWARKRMINGRGFPYEFIFSFDNENYKYNAIDTLDTEIYQEAMILRGKDCIMYKELEKPKIKKYVKKQM